MSKRKCKIVLNEPGTEPYAIAWVKNDREMSGYYDAELVQICNLGKYGYRTVDDGGLFLPGFKIKADISVV